MADAFVGNYKIIRKIAETSGGEVFEAIDRIRNRRAALHCLRAEAIVRPEILEGLLSQVETLARLNHPNIARVFGSIRQGERLYLIMELVEGETLNVILRRKDRIPLTAALAFFRQTLSAVGFAHGMGVVHGNLRPSSIMVTNFGLVKVMDFALAHVQDGPGEGELGKRAVQYLSPEQLRGEPIDGRSDIFSLGVLLYELIVGHVRFDSASEGQPVKILPPSVFASDSPKWVGTWLDAVLRRALAEAPSRRFQSVPEFAHAVGLEIKTQDRTVWKEQPSVRLPNIGPQVFSGSNRVLTTVNFALRSLRNSVGSASEIVRQRSISMGHAIRVVVAANQPTISAQRAIVGLQHTRGVVWSAFTSLWVLTNRMFVSLRAIVAAVAEAGRQRTKSVAHAGRLGVELKNPLVRIPRFIARLKLMALRARSMSEPALITGSHLFRSLRTAFTGPRITRQGTALLASLVIAVAIGGFLLRGENDRPLNEAVDELMTQASSRPIEVKPAQRDAEPQTKLAKPVSKPPEAIDKPVSTRSIPDKEPEPIQRRTEPIPRQAEPIQKRVVVRPTKPAGEEKTSDKETITARAPSREPVVVERKAPTTVATTKLNVRWEN
jgi:serine/threonine protein kinase